MAKVKEKPEEYVHQHFPKAVYNRDGNGNIVSRKVEDPDELVDAEKDGWKESPSAVPTVEGARSEAEKKAATLTDENTKLRQELERLLAKDKSKVDDDEAAIRQIEEAAAAKARQGQPGKR